MNEELRRGPVQQGAWLREAEVVRLDVLSGYRMDQDMAKTKDQTVYVYNDLRTLLYRQRLIKTEAVNARHMN